LEEAIKKIFPDADWQLCVLHAVRDALNKARKKDREALAEALKKIYRAETQKEAEEALWSLRERWGKVYPKIVERWETTAYAFSRSCITLSPSEGTSTPLTSWSGWPRR